MPLTLSDEDEKSILNRTLVLDCPVLELVPLCPSSTRPHYRGSGSVTLSEAGYFEIKLYQSESVPPAVVAALLGLQLGVIVPKKYYYSLATTDVKGRRWQTNRIRPPMPPTRAGGAVIVAEAKQLTLRQKSTTTLTAHLLYLVFAAKIDFPANVLVQTTKLVGGTVRNEKLVCSVAQFSACEIDFEIEEDVEATYLRAKSKNRPFDRKAVNCIAAAFQFVTANLNPWAILELRHDSDVEIRVQATGPDTGPSGIEPPNRDDSPREDAWLLFERYLSYGLRSAEEGHPLWALVHDVLGSGTATIKVQALTLCVAVEALLKTHFKNVIPADPETEQNIEKAKKIFNASDCLDEKFRKRLDGALESFTKTRPADRLHELWKKQLIDVSLKEAWKKLRNPSAHGDIVNLTNDLQLNRHIDKSGAVLVLFYQLVFLLIGYTGQYTDYATHGYPQRLFEARLDNRCLIVDA